MPPFRAASFRSSRSLAAVACTAAAAAAQTAWTQLQPAASPSARVGHAMAYELARDRVVLFGGQDVKGRLNDTWTFDGVSWALATPALAPQPRAGHPLAYDLGRARTVLFGGIGIGTGVLGDTW